MIGETVTYKGENGTMAQKAFAESEKAIRLITTNCEQRMNGFRCKFCKYDIMVNKWLE